MSVGSTILAFAKHIIPALGIILVSVKKRGFSK
jgi:hypothetical protein